MIRMRGRSAVRSTEVNRFGWGTLFMRRPFTTAAKVRTRHARAPGCGKQLEAPNGTRLWVSVALVGDSHSLCEVPTPARARRLPTDKNSKTALEASGRGAEGQFDVDLWLIFHLPFLTLDFAGQLPHQPYPKGFKYQ